MLDRMDPCRIGHRLVNDFADCARGILGFEAERTRDGRVDGGLRRQRIEVKPPLGDVLGVEPTKGEIRIGLGGSLDTTIGAGGARPIYWSCSAVGSPE